MNIINQLVVACVLIVSVTGAAQAQAPRALLGVAATPATSATAATPRMNRLHAAGFVLESRAPGAPPQIGGLALEIASMTAPPAVAGMVQVGERAFSLAQVQVAMKPDDRVALFPRTPWIGDCPTRTSDARRGVVHVNAIVVSPDGPAPVGRLAVVIHPLDGRAVVTGHLALGDRSFAVLATVLPGQQ